MNKNLLWILIGIGVLYFLARPALAMPKVGDIYSPELPPNRYTSPI
jgi:hypothetical protein